MTVVAEASGRSSAPRAGDPGARGAGRCGLAPAALLLVLLVAAAMVAASTPALAAAPSPDAASWLLVDRRDGEVLAAHKPRARRPIASTTKLMTAYLAMKRLRPSDRVRMPPYDAAPAESVAGLRAGEKLSVKDLMHALLIESANDAAVALAVGSSGSVSKFVRAMNRTAERLGLDSTAYANPIGLDQRGNYSTAGDLVELTELLLAKRRFRRIVATPAYVMRSGEQVRSITTSNDLMVADPSIDGVKTGHTSDAGYVLVASAKRSGVPLLSVVLGAPSEAARDQGSAELLDYGYSRYENRKPLRRGAEVASVELRYEDDPLGLRAGRQVRVSARDDQKVTVSVDVPALLEGPIAKGERLGSATVRLDGRVIGRSPLRAARAVSEPGPIDRIGGPLVAAAALGVLVVILLMVARAVRGRGRRGDGDRSREERARSRQERARKRNGS